MINIPILRQISHQYSYLALTQVRQMEALVGAGLPVDPETQKLLGQSIYFLVALPNWCLYMFMLASANDPNPVHRQWANQGAEGFRQLGVKHLQEDGTAWN